MKFILYVTKHYQQQAISRTGFGGFIEKKLRVICWSFWVRRSFDPKIFAKKCLFGGRSKVEMVLSYGSQFF
jgi:hypothetical protein